MSLRKVLEIHISEWRPTPGTKRMSNPEGHHFTFSNGSLVQSLSGSPRSPPIPETSENRSRSRSRSPHYAPPAEVSAEDFQGAIDVENDKETLTPEDSFPAREGKSSHIVKEERKRSLEKGNVQETESGAENAADEEKDVPGDLHKPEPETHTGGHAGDAMYNRSRRVSRDMKNLYVRSKEVFGQGQLLIPHSSHHASLIGCVRGNVRGRDAVFISPFGRKKVVYCDYTASGRCLEFIEKYLAEIVHPFYGNTHTSSNITALQTSQFRDDAREVIRKCVNANSDDAVIFCGSGATAGIHKLIHALMITGKKAENTVVIVGPFEHHSNILPWKETGATVVRVTTDEGGLVDMLDLQIKLERYSSQGRTLIGAFSACSNVTGILTNPDSVSEMLHKYGGLAVWDYATAAPYLKIDMNSSELGYKDAVICSPHKFIGGVGTPGLLIAKKHLFMNPIPGGCGGGTVVYVTHETHVYVSDIEEREEGGTPDIVGSIRAGLAFKLKESIGEDTIQQKDDELFARALGTWKTNPNIFILGSHTARRLPIFALLFRNKESGKILHHNFVAALLNDLYGIQVRGGCACAGPYTLEILGICEMMAQRVSSYLSPQSDEEDKVQKELLILKPGFVRLNLPYFAQKFTINFILHAIDQIATSGWKLLPLYKYDPETGNWCHRFRKIKRRRLGDVTFTNRGINFRHASDFAPKEHITLRIVAREARETMDNALQLTQDLNLSGEPEFPLPENQRHLVWFLLPEQALLYLRNPCLQLLTPMNRPGVIAPQRRTLNRVRSKFRKLITKALGEAKAERMEFLQRAADLDTESEDAMSVTCSLPSSPPPYDVIEECRRARSSIPEVVQHQPSRRYNCCFIQ